MRIFRFAILCLGLALTTTFSTSAFAQNMDKQTTVTKPKGDGPFPAVILLHWTSGVGAPERKWSKTLAANGYAAVILKSSRKIKGTTKDLDTFEPYVPHRVAELNAANAWVKQQSWSNGTVSVFGRSHGGWVVIDALKQGQRFHKAVASAPRCDGARGASAKLRSATPLLIVSGSKDKVVPQAACADFAKRAGRKVTHVIYPSGHEVDLRSKAATSAIVQFLR